MRPAKRAAVRMKGCMVFVYVLLDWTCVYVRIVQSWRCRDRRCSRDECVRMELIGKGK